MANTTPEENMSEALSTGVVDAYISYLNQRVSSKSKKESKYMLFGSKFYETLLSCSKALDVCVDTPRSVSEGEKIKIKYLQKLMKNRTFQTKSHLLIPIEEDGFWFLAVISNVGMEAKSSLRNNPVIIFMDAKPGATHADAELLLQHFLKYHNTISNRQQCNVNAKTIYVTIPANEDPNKSALYLLCSICKFMKTPIDFDALKEDTLLRKLFNIRDIQELEKEILDSSKVPGPHPVFHKNMTCNSRIRCKNCGHFCKNFDRCEKCNRKHIGSEGFQVVLDSEFVHSVVREFKQKLLPKNVLPEETNSLTVKGSSLVEDNTTPAVKAATSTSSTSEFDFLGENSATRTKSKVTSDNTSGNMRRLKAAFKSPVTEILDANSDSQSTVSTATNFGSNYMTLFIYPPVPVPGVGSVCLLLSDYECLKDGECLNDSVIEFYLKYLYLNEWTEQDKNRTHIFNSFFYEKLTDVALTGLPEKEYAEKMHANVKKWTKNVNIFEKEVVIVPINLEFHWIVAIICFYELQAIPKRNSVNNSKRPSSKHARIMIFDSMSGSLRAKDIPDHLQKYLEMEYLHKYQKPALHFKNCKIYFPEVPQQPNGYDCGIFVLQFVESFFKSPIADFSQPLMEWFSKEEVSNKRQHVADVIKKVMTNQNLPIDALPDLIFKKNRKRKKNKRNPKSKDSTNDVTEQESESSDINVDKTQSKTENNYDESEMSDEKCSENLNLQVPEINDQTSNISEIQEDFSVSDSTNNNDNHVTIRKRSKKRPQDEKKSAVLEKKISPRLKKNNKDSQTEQEGDMSSMAFASNLEVSENDGENSTTSENQENFCLSEVAEDCDKHLLVKNIKSNKSQHDLNVSSDLTSVMEKEMSPRLRKSKKASQSEAEDEINSVDDVQHRVKNKKSKNSGTNLSGEISGEVSLESSQSNGSASSSQSPTGTPKKLRRNKTKLLSHERSQLSLDESQNSASTPLSQTDENVTKNMCRKKQLNRKKRTDISEEASQMSTDSNSSAVVDLKPDESDSEVQNCVAKQKTQKRCKKGMADVSSLSLSQEQSSEAEGKSVSKMVSSRLKLKKSNENLTRYSLQDANELSPKPRLAQSSQSTPRGKHKISQQSTPLAPANKNSSQSESTPTVKRCSTDKMYIHKRKKAKESPKVNSFKVVVQSSDSDNEYETAASSSPAEETLSGNTQSKSKNFKNIKSGRDSLQDSKHSVTYSVNTKSRLHLRNTTQNSMQKKADSSIETECSNEIEQKPSKRNSNLKSTRNSKYGAKQAHKSSTSQSQDSQDTDSDMVSKKTKKKIIVSS